MFKELMSRIDPSLLEGVSIFNYVGQADFNQTTIYWNQLSWDQQAVQFLSDPDLRGRIDHFVFVSHWQAEKFRQAFSVPGYKTHVITNASAGTAARDPGRPTDRVRVCYTSTPWRGLDVLLDAWEALAPTDCELHVFSSTKIYGTDFHSVADLQYKELYERARSLPGVVYRDFVPNGQLRAELHEFDIMAYPCTFEETSCISVIEALGAGLKVVCSNIGALPETTEGWARLYPYRVDKATHAQHFALVLGDTIRRMRAGEYDEALSRQVEVYSPRWSWDARLPEWSSFLAAVREAREAQAAAPPSRPSPGLPVPQMAAGDVVLDIGAHEGSFARRCLEAGAGRVVCVEPAPANVQSLQAAAAADERVQVVGAAAWSKSGLAISFSTARGVAPGDNSMGTAFTRAGDLRVPTVSLDELISPHERVRLLKVDAEGSEYPALMSSALLGRVSEVVGTVNDVSPANNLEPPLSYNKEVSRGDLLTFLESQGFAVETWQWPWPHSVCFRATRDS